MPDIVTHFLVCLSFFVPAFLNYKNANLNEIFIFLFLIFIFSIFPDFDHLFNSHRSFTHSLIFVFIVSLMFSYFYLKFRNIYSLFFILSVILHIILDIFYGGVKLFYPFDGKIIYLERTYNYKLPILEMNTSIDLLVVILSLIFLFWYLILLKLK